MMAKPPLDFMEKYGIDSDEVWEVRPGTWAVKHAALERVANEQGIVFDPPALFGTMSLTDKTVAILVTATMKDRHDWSTGEAAPYNNKNGYPVAMAEKRARDRVTLKLLNAHGAIYSDAEADDFQKPANGSVVQRQTLPKKDAKEIYTKMQAEIREAQSRDQLKTWGIANKDRIKILPEDWQDILRLQFEEMSADLRNKEAA